MSAAAWLDARFGRRRTFVRGWALYAPAGDGTWRAVRVCAGEPRMRATVRLARGAVDVIACERGVALADFLDATRLRDGALAPAVVGALVSAVAARRPGAFARGGIRIDGDGRLLRGAVDDPYADDVALLEDAAREVAERAGAARPTDDDVVDLGALVRGLFPDAVAADDADDEDLATGLAGDAVGAWSTERHPVATRVVPPATPLNLARRPRPPPPARRRVALGVAVVAVAVAGVALLLFLGAAA